MPESKPRFCMRCGKPAVRADSATEEVWHCPNQHGVIYRAPLELEPQEPEPEGAKKPPLRVPRNIAPAPPPPKKKKK